MKIALIGYGKMGKTIEKLATQSGHEIVCKVGRQDSQFFNQPILEAAEVAIEFSQPQAAIQNIKRCIDLGVPVVSGTTGWNEQMEEVQQYCLSKNGAFFYASNFSIGVYLFSRINEQLAKMMNPHSNYEVKMEEIHHTQKLDAPSGTAISLANGLLNNLERKSSWVNEPTDNAATLPIISKRIENVPGTHTIEWNSPIDRIKIEHIAHSRDGFAGGAIAAAQWIIGRKGIFGMHDLLGF